MQIYLSKKYLRRLILVLRTPYWRLIYQDFRRYKQPAMVVPEPSVISQNEDWKILEILGLRFFWPTEYSNRGLRGLYREVFAPPKVNPHAYETGNVKILEGEWVVDAGACEGFFVHYALQRGAKVLAVEPVPRLAEALTQTFTSEIKKGQVIVLNAGIADKSGFAHIQVNTNDVYCSTIGDVEGEKIRLVTLDELVQEKIVPSINFIKMDIEGAEIKALRGSFHTLKEFRPKLSIAVYHEYKNAIILRELLENCRTDYNIFFRGLFIRESFGLPRPYMLFAEPDK
jgi:FkbM family methyltransferase